MINRKNKILTAVSLICRSSEFRKFEKYFEAEYDGLAADVFEFTIRGMGDHGTTIEKLDEASGTFDCSCACGRVRFDGVTLQTLWTKWSAHVHWSNLEELRRQYGEHEAKQQGQSG